MLPLLNEVFFFLLPIVAIKAFQYFSISEWMPVEWVRHRRWASTHASDANANALSYSPFTAKSYLYTSLKHQTDASGSVLFMHREECEAPEKNEPHNQAKCNLFVSANFSFNSYYDFSSIGKHITVVPSLLRFRIYIAVRSNKPQHNKCWNVQMHNKKKGAIRMNLFFVQASRDECFQPSFSLVELVASSDVTA